MQYRLAISAKRTAVLSPVNWVWFSERHGLALFSCATQGAFSLPSSCTAEAAQGHERLEAKWRPLVYPPWKPSHALSSTWGIWWKPFVSTPLNYQPEEEPLMLSSDNGSQHSSLLNTVPTNNEELTAATNGDGVVPAVHLRVRKIKEQHRKSFACYYNVQSFLLLR